jgi:hypothetical protein
MEGPCVFNWRYARMNAVIREWMVAIGFDLSCSEIAWMMDPFDGRGQIRVEDRDAMRLVVC